MTPEQEAHLARVLSRVNSGISEKYRAGQAEHGGNLWDKSGLLEEALKEAIDQVIYLTTLIEQRDAINRVPLPMPVMTTGKPVTHWKLGRFHCSTCKITRVVVRHPDVDEVRCTCGAIAIEGGGDD